MGVKIFVLLGILILCVGAPADDTLPSTSTSYSVSTVTRKVTAKSVSRLHQSESGSGLTERTVTVIQDEDKSPPSLSANGDGDGDGGVTKPLKIKKKILVSNLKNASDKVVLPSDKHDKHLIKPVVVGGVEGTDGKDGEKPLSSGSAEDDVNEEVLVRSENVTEEVHRNKTWSDSEQKTGAKRKEGSSGGVEGRSLEDRSSEENVNVNSKSKTKNTTERTTSSYTYENYGEPQKVLNNNYLNNNEGYEHRSGFKNVRPSPSVIFPARKSTPISGDNSLKNAIRFESEYYGPTGQTDWVPVIPDKLPVRPASGSQEFGNKLRTERLNKTAERNVVVFPSDGGVQPSRVNNVVVVQETTSSHRNTVEKPVRVVSGSEDGRTTSGQSQPIRTPIKFRGAVRYKSSNHSNLTLDERRFQNRTTLRRSNSSTETPETGSSGASWTLATLRDSASTKPTVRPVREDATEISVFTVVSTTNHTKKSQNGVDSGLAVPPQNVKVDNMTKEHEKDSTSSGSNVRNVSPSVGNHNESVITNIMPKLTEPKEGPTSTKTVKSGETVNDTYVIIPGSVDINQNNKSIPAVGVIIPSTLEPETTSIEVTTEESSTVESVQELTTVQKTLNPVTENSVISSQSSIATNSSDDFTEQPVTTPLGKGSVVTTTEEETVTTFGKVATTDKSSMLSSVEETNGEMTTEVEPTTVKTVTEEPVNESVSGVTGSTQGSPVSNTTVMMSVVNTTTGLPSFTHVNNTTTATILDTSVNITTTIPTSLVNITSEMPVVRFTTTNTTIEVTQMSNSTTTTTTTTEATVPITTVNFTATTSPKPTTEIPVIKFTPETTSSPVMITTESTTTKPPTTAATTTSTTVTTPISSTKVDNEESKPETTEESIIYKNYIPTTVNPRDEITEENVPAYLRLTVQASSWEELCRLKEDLRDAIIKMLGGKNVSYDSVHFLNLNERNCFEKIEETKGEQTNGTIFLPVNMFLMDKNGDFDKNLSEAFLTMWGRRGLDFELPIRKVDFVTPIVNLTELADSPLGGSVVAAIVISCVAGICVILLGILFVIMKRRQKRFNYGQRCTPVSLDAYSLDSVSIYNSVRRKGIRASKRSYGNAAFDDPEVPTHPMNFAGLANFSSDKDQLYEEFNIIPQVYPKADELPAGAETKNRYANIIPLPETRVHLTVRDGDALSDYINANYVRGLKGAEKLYIACQAPMESTLEDFWRMIWEQQCKVILMLTDLQENGIEKCADYLPPNEVTDNLRLFGDYQVTLKKRDVKEKYIISHLVLKNMETNLWREITHLWYLGWPDQGVPTEANSIIAFLIEARSQTKIQNGATTSSPTVVHCSPGTGRTGTVIACDLCIREYEQTRMVDIPKCVFNLRRDRAGAVQTKDQYAFIYQVLNVYATKLSGGGIESI